MFHVIKGEKASELHLKLGSGLWKAHLERLICAPFSLGDTVGMGFTFA